MNSNTLMTQKTPNGAPVSTTATATTQNPTGPPPPPVRTSTATSTFSRPPVTVCKVSNCTNPPMSPISEHSASSPCTGDIQQQGFNSSCQQCIAEREAAAAAAAVCLNKSSGSGNGSYLNHVTSSSSSSAFDNSSSPTVAVDFPAMPTQETLDTFQEIEESRGGVRRQSADHEPPGRTYECEVHCREAFRLLAGCLGIVCLTLGYACIGGLLFMALESETSSPMPLKGSGEVVEMRHVETPTVMNVTAPVLELPKEVQQSVAKARGETVQKLWMVTEQMNILYPENWTRKAAQEIIWFQDQMTKAFAQEFKMLKAQASQQQISSSSSHKGQNFMNYKRGPWTFARGFFYSVSLLTTIGCDFTWSSTPVSKAVSVVFVIIGLPIMYLYITYIGQLAAKCIGLAIAKLRKRPRPRQGRKSAQSTASNSPAKDDTLKSSVSSLPRSGSGRRTTWQTKGSLHNNSSSGFLVGNNGNSRNSEDMDYSRIYVNKSNFGLVVLVCVTLAFFHIICGSLLVSSAQGWNLGESFYFCFLSAVTIGHGGIGTNDPNLWPLSLYTFLSVALLATCYYLLKSAIRGRGITKRRKHGSTLTLSRRASSLRGSVESISKEMSSLSNRN